mgnify:CR=1 FL=1
MIDELRYTCGPMPTATALAARAGLLEAEFSQGEPPLRRLPDPAHRRPPGRRGGHDPAGLIREGGNVFALWARARGAPTRLVALSWGRQYQAVLARPGSGITAPADLAGRTVGVPCSPGRRADVPGAAALRGFERALHTAGLGLSDVRVLEIPDGAADGPDAEDHRAVAAALADGTVDAVWVRGSAGEAVRRALGAVEVAALGDHPDPFVRAGDGTPTLITVHAGLLEERPDLVARYLAVLLRATRGAGVAALDLVPGLDGDRLAVLAEQSAFLELHGFIDGHVDLGLWTDPRPLQCAWELAAESRPAFPSERDLC